jgi:hypothetical protein
LTAKILEEPGPVIAMSTDHRLFLAERFNRRNVPLFTQACGLEGEPLPDIHEAVSDYETNPTAAAAHVRMIIDRIIQLTPRLAIRLLQS